MAQDGSSGSILAEGEIRNADSWWASTPNIRNLNVWDGAVYYSGTGGDIHRVDIASGADTTVMDLALTGDQYSFTNMLIYRGKILYSLRNRKEDTLTIGVFDASTLEINWQADICKNAEVLESDDRLRAGTVNSEIRYILDGDSLVCLKWNYEGDDVEIWYVPGMDFGKAELLITVTAPDTKGKDGVYYPYCGEKAEDTVYFLFTDENGTLTLICVDENGTLTQTPVQ